jgi:hypothetical protein
MTGRKGVFEPWNSEPELVYRLMFSLIVQWTLGKPSSRADHSDGDLPWACGIRDFMNLAAKTDFPGCDL